MQIVWLPENLPVSIPYLTFDFFKCLPDVNDTNLNHICNKKQHDKTTIVTRSGRGKWKYPVDEYPLQGSIYIKTTGS